MEKHIRKYFKRTFLGSRKIEKSEVKVIVRTISFVTV